MAAKSNALKLVSTPVRHKTGLPRSPQTRQFQQLAVIWNALPVDARTEWKTLSQTTNFATAVGVKTRRSGYSLFVGLNTMLSSIGYDYNTQAPIAPEQPYPLPALTLTATLTGGALAIDLTAAAAYSPQVIVYAAPPAYAGNNTYSNKSFKRIGCLSGLTSGANNIAALYQTKYRIPAPGYEIALKIVGVMDSGFSTNGVIVTGIVTG